MFHHRLTPQALERKSATVVEQYRLMSASLERIFALCPDTSWKDDGIGGCCYDATADDAPPPLIPDWQDRRHARRLEANPDSWPEHTKRACFYHEPDVGCCLGDLKAPICLGYTKDNQHLPESFAKLGDVTFALAMVLQGRPDERGADGEPAAPERNWPAVRDWLCLAEEVRADAERAYRQRTGKIPLPNLEPRPES